MDTYSFLSQACTRFLGSFKLYERDGILRDSLLEFCASRSQDSAQAVYSAFLQTYRTPGLEQVVEAMRCYETQVAQLLPRQRDHFIHSVDVMLLGLAMYACNEKTKAAIDSDLVYDDKYPDIREEFLYRWGIAALFHDAGYPLEITYKALSEFVNLLVLPNLLFEGGEVSVGLDEIKGRSVIPIMPVKDLKDLLHINLLPPRPGSEDSYYLKYPKLRHNAPSSICRAIAENISQLGFARSGDIKKVIESRIKEGLKTGRIDHGIYSSLILLKWTNHAFSIAGWNPAYYYYAIVDSATAIFLHNAYQYMFQDIPYNCQKLNITNDSLSFMLILCDRLQETDRFDYGYIDSPVAFAKSCLEVDSDKLILKLIAPHGCDTNLVRQYVKNVEDSITQTLDMASIVQDFEVAYEVS